MQRYAPDAHADPEQGWVESEETVKELVKWREEAILLRGGFHLGGKLSVAPTTD